MKTEHEEFAGWFLDMQDRTGSGPGGLSLLLVWGRLPVADWLWGFGWCPG